MRRPLARGGIVTRAAAGELRSLAGQDNNMSSSTAQRLVARLTDIEARLLELVRTVPVLEREDRGGPIVIIAPRHWFASLTPQQQRAQLTLRREYDRWIEHVRLILRGAPDDLQRQLDEADQEWRTWLEMKSSWVLEPASDKNAARVKSAGSDLRGLLSVVESDLETLLVIPDTNALLGAQDATQYRAAVAADTFTLVLLPTVLRELDELKMLHRNPDVREKAAKMVARIKGWRNQGPLLGGVTVDRTITVVAVAEEPNVKATLSWLDPDSADDRIVAGVLEVQVRHPSDRVVLVTGDINLQNKADAAAVEVVEPPAA